MYAKAIAQVIGEKNSATRIAVKFECNFNTIAERAKLY